MRKYIYHLNIFQRLLLYFVSIIIISISIVTILTYIQSSKEIKKQSLAHLNYVVESTRVQIDNLINDVEEITLPLINNNDIKSFLELDSSEQFDKYMLTKSIKKQMNNIILQNKNISTLTVFSSDEKIIISENNFLSENIYEHDQNILNQIKTEDKEVNKEKNKKVTLERSLYNNTFIISMTKNLNGFKSFNPLGVLRIEIPTNTLGEIWNISNNKNSNLLIFDENNKIIYHPNKEIIGTTLNEDLQHVFSESNENVFIDKWDNEEYIFSYTTSPTTHWTLVAMTPKSIVFSPLAGLNKSVLITIMVSLLIAVFFSVIFTKSIVKPIRKVQIGMKQTEKGKWKKIKRLKGTDEISSLVISYNKMVDKLSTLMEQLYKTELEQHRILFEKQSIELQALQLQINPHFLYNSLETINGYAILHDENEISKMVVALSKMFRYSIENLKIVNLGEELKHIKNYLILEEHRFQQKIKVQYEIPEKYYMVDVVKLTLQPLIENAVQHGIKKQLENHLICIKAYEESGNLVIKIKDNGKGIHESRLEEIKNVLKINNMNNGEDNNFIGIGLLNVHRRIKIIFGQEYGINIISKENKGTTIKVKIPLICNEMKRQIAHV